MLKCAAYTPITLERSGIYLTSPLIYSLVHFIAGILGLKIKENLVKYSDMDGC